VRPPGIDGPGGPRGPGHSGGSAYPAGLGALARSHAIPRYPGTVNVNQRTLNAQANEVRNNFNHNGAFSRDWYGRHERAWRAAAWATAGAAAAYGIASWGDYAGYSGGSSGGSGYSSGDSGYSSGDSGYSGSSSYYPEPAYYDYGSNVVYDDGNVYVNGDSVGTQEEYAEQAETIAHTGKQARASEEEEWLSLGVFAMVQGEQVNGNDLFQLAVNKSGVIRGNYYNALSDTTLPVYGSVDRKTQRAAWKVGDREEPVFEAGIANLTKSQTTMLVHHGKDRTQQWTLVRIEPSAKPK
jgi:hypothetical protein